MSPSNNGREITILETNGILIKNQSYHVVLTGRQIIFTGDSDHKPRSIGLREVKNIELGTDDLGNPEILVFVLSVNSETNKVVLHFSQHYLSNPLQQRYVWFSEINKILQEPVRDSPSCTPETVSTEPAFCPRCGKRLAEGSAFCDHCGAPVMHADQLPLHGHATMRERMAPDILMADRRPVPDADSQYSDNRGPAMVPEGRKIWKKKGIFTGTGVRNPAVIAGLLILIGVIVIAAFSLFTHPGSSVLNISSPTADAVKSATIVPITTADPPVNSPGSAPLATSVAITTELSEPGPTTPRPSITVAPGDPGTVLSPYPLLFNAEDGNGIWALLATDIKSQYSLDDLNNDLDVAHSIGNSIDTIRITNQIINGDNATLIVDITWKTTESPVTRTQNLLLVREDNQWKLNTLILHP